MVTHNSLSPHLSVHRRTWDEGKGIRGAMGMEAQRHSSSHLPAPNTAKPCRGMRELGSGEVCEAGQVGSREAESWTGLGVGVGMFFPGSLNEHIHSLSQASLSNSSASLLSGITFSTSCEIQKQGWVSNS